MAPSTSRAYAEFVSDLHRDDAIAHAVVILFNIYRGPANVNGTQYLKGTHDADGRPNREFWRSRIPVFKESTLRSLANQSSDNFFVVWLYEQTTDFPEGFLEEFQAEVQAELGVPFELAPIDPVDFTRDYQHAFWKRRIYEESAIRRHIGSSSTLYITYLDGDDLLHRDYVCCMQEQESRAPEDTQVICVPNGFIYASATNRIRVWDRAPKKTQPPFFTLRYKSAHYLGGQRLDGGPGRHLWVAGSLKPWVVHERMFAQHCHGLNDSTAYFSGTPSPDLSGDGARRLITQGFGQR